MTLPAYLDNPVDRQILNELQKFSQKHIEPLDFDPAEHGTVKIFNVGPFSQESPQGGLGTFRVPACEDKMPYSVPLEILKMFPEGKNDDMNKMSLRICDGFSIAESIVQYGKHSNQNTSLLRYGIFTCGAYATFELPNGKREVVQSSERKLFTTSYRRDGIKLKEINTRIVTPIAVKAAQKRGDTRDEQEIAGDILAANLPTEAELDEANKNLTDWKVRLVKEADMLFRGDNLREIQELHRWAAAASGNSDRPWLKSIASRELCTVCTAPINPGQAICVTCRSIIPGMEHIVKQRRVPGYEWLWQAEVAAEPKHKSAGK